MEFFKRREEDAHNFVYEKFMPPFAWRDDSICHYLLLDLPGFRKEWIKIEVDDDHVLVSGERRVSDDKMLHFEQSFKVPENSDIKKITGRYEAEVLYVVIPKKLKEEANEVDSTEATGCIEAKHEELKEDNEEPDDEEWNDDEARLLGEEGLEEAARSEPIRQNEKGGIVGSVSGMFRENLGFVVSIVLAFSLGVLVSHKFHSDFKNRTNLPVVV